MQARQEQAHLLSSSNEISMTVAASKLLLSDNMQDGQEQALLAIRAAYTLRSKYPLGLDSVSR